MNSQPFLSIRKKKLLFTSSVVILSVTNIILITIRVTTLQEQTTVARSKGRKTSSADTATPERRACIIPHLMVNGSRETNLVKIDSSETCPPDTDWAFLQDGKIKFSDKLVYEDRVGFTCVYHPLIRGAGDDWNDISFGKPTPNIEEGFLITSDFCKITCESEADQSYTGYHAGIAFRRDRMNRVEDPLSAGFEGMSVVVLGFGFISRRSWLSRLPKTRSYFKNTLGAVELEQHNTVGFGSTGGMMPLLTGKFEWDLPESRRGIRNAQHLDGFPFIWKDFKKAGYLTSWANDHPAMAPFNYLKLGFREQPTDFYLRPFMLQGYRKRCIGSRSTRKLWFQWFKDIFLTYPSKRKFLLHYMSDIANGESGEISMLDEDIVDAVKFLVEGGHLKNTLLILMGNHGARFEKELADTFMGKLETRLPYVGLLFPDWFQKKYHQAMKNLRGNSQRLTTPFDLHEMFMDFLHYGGDGTGSVKDRGISLFKEIPINRTCEDAGIAPHWCACLNSKELRESDDVAKMAVDAAVKQINVFTEKLRAECAELKHLRTTNVSLLTAREEVVRSRDAGGFDRFKKINTSAPEPHFRDKTQYYKVKFHTTPGGGQFEATIAYAVHEKQLYVAGNSVSRINEHNYYPHCVLYISREIRQYCQCRS